MLTTGAILDPDILSFDASDAIGIIPGQTKTQVKQVLRNTLNRLSGLSFSDQQKALRLAHIINPLEDDQSDEDTQNPDPTTVDVRVEEASELIKATLAWLDAGEAK